MSVEYYAENHDWDMTLRAAWYLAVIGQAKVDKPEHSFSCFTGSMLLSFCAIESFMNSIAFTMARNDKYSGFNYDKFEKLRGFWPRLKMVLEALAIEIDSELVLMQNIEKMRVWRIALVHSSPYAVEATEIEEPNLSRALHGPFREREYIGNVKYETADLYYQTAVNLIELIKKRSGLDPRAMAQYKIL